MLSSATSSLGRDGSCWDGLFDPTGSSSLEQSSGIAVPIFRSSPEAQRRAGEVREERI